MSGEEVDLVTGEKPERVTRWRSMTATRRCTW
jgi:hypothetical protein